jgi:hypothetical protein
MNNFISIANHFNLVIFTDEKSISYIQTQNKPNIIIVVKPIESFFNYKYKDFWITNHTKNRLLNNKISWELNMLWCEKIAFVKETIEKQYFATQFYGWCDIGYFRNKNNDTHTNLLKNWPNLNKIYQLDIDKIYYGCVNNNEHYIQRLIQQINNKNSKGLPQNPIPENQISISGGFFITHYKNIDWWFHTFNQCLFTYIQNNRLVKDDQIILADCIFTQPERFVVLFEQDRKYNNWFMFQRILN